MITNEGAEHSWQQQNVVTPRAWPGHPDTCRAVAADLSHTLHGLVTALGNEDQVITELSLDWPLNLADLAGGEHHVIELLDHLRCSTASQRTAFYTNQRIVCTMRLLDIKTWPGPNSPREPPDLPEGHVECSLASSVNLAITSLDASIAALSSRHLASSLTVGARQSMHRAAHARALLTRYAPRMWLADAETAAAVPTSAARQSARRTNDLVCCSQKRTCRCRQDVHMHSTALQTRVHVTISRERRKRGEEKTKTIHVHFLRRALGREEMQWLVRARPSANVLAGHGAASRSFGWAVRLYGTPAGRAPQSRRPAKEDREAVAQAREGGRAWHEGFPPYPQQTRPVQSAHRRIRAAASAAGVLSAIRQAAPHELDVETLAGNPNHAAHACLLCPDCPEIYRLQPFRFLRGANPLNFCREKEHANMHMHVNRMTD